MRAVVGTALLFPAATLAQRPEVTLISRAADGGPTNGRSELPAVNADGSIIAFKSAASNIIAVDGNGAVVDVFLYQRDGGPIVRIPGNTAFPPSYPDGESFPPGLDYSGNIVGFASEAPNLVRNDFNAEADAFVYERNPPLIDILTLVLDDVGEGTLGGRVPLSPVSVNADGNFLVFTSASDSLVSSDSNEVSDVFLYNRISDKIELISITNLGGSVQAGNGRSTNGAVSGDANFVVFCSEASNLAPGTPEGLAGIFLRNRVERTTRLIAPLGRQRCLQPEYLPAINESGDYVAFASDLQLDQNDDNGVADVFVWHDDTIVRISEGLDGAAANGPSLFPSISANGTFIAFQSSASNLIENDDNQSVDVFVTDIFDRRLARASETAGGESFPAASNAPRMSADGGTVVFQSDARLAPEDQNNVQDIYSVVNVLSFTPTPTPTEPTATPTLGEPTPTATSGDGPPTPTATPTIGGATMTPATSTPAMTATSTLTPPPATAITPVQATPTATSTMNGGGGGGGGGGGCSCRIDPRSGRPTDSAPWQALLLPAALWVWRRRRWARS